jgi:hypothetical protein
MAETVLDGELGVERCVGPIHGLQEKMAEVQLLELFRRRILLGINELELAPPRLDQGRSGLGAYTDPIKRVGRGSGAVGFDGDLKAAIVQFGDQLLVELEERLPSSADDVLLWQAD